MSTTAQNDTMTIGTKLVEFCRNGKNLDAINELYADNITSVEAMTCPEDPSFEQTMTGRDKIIEKNNAWFGMNELHSAEFDGPFPHGDKFIVSMKYDITPKQGPMAGNRMTFSEMGLYTVENGKIVREEFFYSMG